MSQAQPTIPPRPQRTQAIAETQNAAQLPQIPPRPTSKRVERSVSPANYPHSPLNQPYGLARSRNGDPIQRPPSVSRLPMSGEEGMEYGEVQYQPQAPVSALGSDAAAQTRQISDDLPMHAPKPSLPTTSATAQVQAVTRTDSSSAVGPGIGRPPSQDGEPLGRTRSRASFSRPDSAASGDRRRSMYGDDQYGPAEIGIRVPINPLLGDVQAPSPAPGLSPHHTGGQHIDNRKRQHHRTKSGREVFLPPGSYGLHGHGVPVTDKFEKDWYAKHPEQAEQEETHGHGVYESIGSGRGSFAMSSDDLNKIVRSTASGGHGFGTSGKVVSYPDEQIGYMASEQYQSRQTTPAQTPGLYKSASISDPIAQSPLRKASVLSHDEPTEQNLDPVHVDAPARKYNKVTGGQGTLTDKEEVKPYITHPTEKNGLTNEHGYSVPILAEDEVAKVVGFEHLQPAVSPVQQRRGSSNYDEYGNDLPPRPSSRPGSIYNLHSASNSLSRFHSHHDDREHLHTPLEDVDEYEPLFPEDDKKKAVSAAERFKRRPDSLRHKFPSQDIWEDTPSSAMYEATVSTPDLPHQTRENDRVDDQAITNSTFETPAAEAARKGEVSEEEKKKLVPAEERLLKSKFAPHLRDDMPTRPGMQPRFPSQDVWEDSPDSQSLYTTVNEPEPEPESQRSPVEAKPTIPTRPAKSRLGEGASSSQIAPSVEPSVPAQQEKLVHAVPPIDAKLTDTTSPLSKEVSPTDLRKVPSIPDRPKPQIPARPKKADTETLSKVTSASSQDSTETERGAGTQSAVKAKPQVPARPQGSKIANLRSTFMSDLNAKLGMGPPKEKEPEPEPELEPEEAKPLEDARKGRARGPQRRAPAKSPSAPTQKAAFAISKAQSLWHIDDQNSLNVSAAKTQSQLSNDKMEQIKHSTAADAPLPPMVDTSAKVNTEAEKRSDDAPKALAPSLASNMAGEYVDPAPVSTESQHASSGAHASSQSALPEKDLSTGVLEQTAAVDEERIHATERDPAI